MSQSSLLRSNTRGGRVRRLVALCGLGAVLALPPAAAGRQAAPNRSEIAGAGLASARKGSPAAPGRPDGSETAPGALAAGRCQAMRAGDAPDPPGSFHAHVRPTLRIGRLHGKVRVDGRLDDPGWRDAARASGFAEVQPGDNVAPQARTEVWAGYDDEALYLAFVACDAPSSVRATLSQRDEMYSDDWVGLMLYTVPDASWGYEIFVNPLGVQGDLRRLAGGHEDSGFDLVFQSQGRITASGYQVEIAIPFSSLRFPDREQQSWRVDFFRNRPRGSRQQISWVELDRDEPCFECQLGTLTGIRGVRPGGSLEILPSVTASEAAATSSGARPGSGLDAGPLDGQLSMGGKYVFSGGLTAEATYNPDFSQVESDATLIDANTTFALFYPERRPFFQEGSDLFDTPIDAIYTRSINDPRAAAKATGRLAPWSFVYLGAVDEHTPVLLPFQDRSFVGEGGRSVASVARGKLDLGSDSYVGMLLTDRRYASGGGSNTVAGPDLRLRFARQYLVRYQLLASHTAEPQAAGPTSSLRGETFDDGAHTSVFDGERFGGWAQSLSLSRESRHSGSELHFESASPAFRADDGFVTRNDDRQLTLSQGLTFYPNGRLVRRFDPSVEVSRSWNFDGIRKKEYAEPYLEGMLAGQTNAGFGYYFANERFRGVDLRGIGRAEAYVSSRFSDPVQIFLSLSRGEFVARNTPVPLVGRGTEAELDATLKPIQRLVIEPSVNFSELARPSGEKIFSGFIWRARATFLFSRALSLRTVVQYDEFAHRLDFEPLFSYQVNPFTLFYVGSSLDYADGGAGPGEQAGGLAPASRQFFAKFQYLLRL